MSTPPKVAVKGPELSQESASIGHPIAGCNILLVATYGDAERGKVDVIIAKAIIVPNMPQRYAMSIAGMGSAPGTANHIHQGVSAIDIRGMTPFICVMR